MSTLPHLSCIIADIGRWDKSLHDPLLLDLKKVEQLVVSRGIGVVMIDFPDACKVFDASLSRGYLDFQSMPNLFGFTKDGIGSKTIFKVLWDRLFTSSGMLFADSDVNDIFFLRQLLLLYKKVDMPCPDSNIVKAVSEFQGIESSMRKATLLWNTIDEFVPDSSLSVHDANLSEPLFGKRKLPFRLLEALERVLDFTFSEFPLLDPNSVVPKHGPGSVSDLGTGKDKYQFPNWPMKLSSVFEFETFGIPNYNFIGDLEPSDQESYAKLIAVPKTLKSPRLIASEPVAHQFLQQGLMGWFRKNLTKTLSQSINFLNQDLSKDAALLASRDGRSCTVDLSSASDRLSCWLVERALRKRPDLLRALYAVRTTNVVIDMCGISDRILLKKYANQGSAMTFTLQSIIYACICVAALLFESGGNFTTRRIRRSFSEVRVFGDDLIIPSVALVSVDQLLAYCGLKVNHGKTHYSGKFRESCGIDAYDGFDVSPLYLSNLELTDDFSGLSSLVDMSNQAYLKGLWSLSEYLLAQVPQKYAEKLIISPRPLGGLYLRTYQNGTFTKTRTRWNKNTQSVEGLLVTASVRKKQGGRVSGQDLLHYFISEELYDKYSLPVDAFSISRKRSFDYRTRLKVRWVPLRTSV